MGQQDDVPDDDIKNKQNTDEIVIADELKNVRLKKVKLKEEVNQHADMRKVDTIARGDGVQKICKTRNIENFKDKMNFFKNLQQKSSASTSHGGNILDGPSHSNFKESDSCTKLSEENGPMGEEIRHGPMRREDTWEVNSLK